MGKVTVLYFAAARDAAGRKRETMEIRGKVPAREMLDRIVLEHPGLASMKGSVRLSVNQEVVASDHPLRDGDELGVLPPVAGG